MLTMAPSATTAVYQEEVSTAVSKETMATKKSMTQQTGTPVRGSTYISTRLTAGGPKPPSVIKNEMRFVEVTKEARATHLGRSCT